MIQKKKLAWQHVLLATLLIASLLLHFWSLEKEGYSNPYYAAAVQGMLDNPSAFFYGSFDSGLYVTVDKPAFGLWLQALSAGVFGVNSFGLILPSALAGTLCVLLLFFIVRKKWGDTAGVIAAGIMAFTPILVALSRTNNLDVLLLFFLLCGTLLMQRAVDRQSLPLYLAAMACVGIGFNIKMLQAYLVMPAFLFWYLLGNGKWLKKILHTVLALVALFIVSFSWALAVDFTPVSERPYIGGSDSNSVIELALGYNGLNRLLGPQRDRNAQAQDDGQFDETLPPNRPALNPDAVRPAQRPPNDRPAGTDIAPRSGGGVGGSSENGDKGVFRLFDEQLGGLASWFLLPALGLTALGGAGVLQWLKKRRSAEWTQERSDELRQTLFWAAWLLPMVVFFSVAGFMHRYYVVMIAPAVAALGGILAVRAWRSERSRLLVPLAVLLTLTVQCVFVLRSSWIWLVLPMLATATIAVLLFLTGKKPLAAVLLALALFIAPVAWSITPVIGTMNSHIPDAGPDVLISAAAERKDSAADELAAYITEHYAGERWALAVPSANIAAPIVLETGLPVMAVGGFSGGDDILTVDTLKEYIASGSIRYFWITGQQAQDEVYRWVRQHGTAVRLSARVTIFDLTGAAEQSG